MTRKTAICSGCGEPFTYSDVTGGRYPPEECGICDTGRFDL